MDDTSHEEYLERVRNYYQNRRENRVEMEENEEIPESSDENDDFSISFSISNSSIEDISELVITNDENDAPRIPIGSRENSNNVSRTSHFSEHRRDIPETRPSPQNLPGRNLQNSSRESNNSRNNSQNQISSRQASLGSGNDNNGHRESIFFRDPGLPEIVPAPIIPNSSNHTSSHESVTFRSDFSSTSSSQSEPITETRMTSSRPAPLGFRDNENGRNTNRESTFSRNPVSPEIIPAPLREVHQGPSNQTQPAAQNRNFNFENHRRTTQLSSNLSNNNSNNNSRMQQPLFGATLFPQREHLEQSTWVSESVLQNDETFNLDPYEPIIASSGVDPVPSVTVFADIHRQDAERQRQRDLEQRVANLNQRPQTPEQQRQRVANQLTMEQRSDLNQNHYQMRNQNLNRNQNQVQNSNFQRSENPEQQRLRTANQLITEQRSDVLNPPQNHYQMRNQNLTQNQNLDRNPNRRSENQAPPRQSTEERKEQLVRELTQPQNPRRLALPPPSRPVGTTQIIPSLPLPMTSNGVFGRPPAQSSSLVRNGRGDQWTEDTRNSQMRRDRFLESREPSQSNSPVMNDLGRYGGANRQLNQTNRNNNLMGSRNVSDERSERIPTVQVTDYIFGDDDDLSWQQQNRATRNNNVMDNNYYSGSGDRSAIPSIMNIPIINERSRERSIRQESPSQTLSLSLSPTPASVPSQIQQLPTLNMNDETMDLWVPRPVSQSQPPPQNNVNPVVLATLTPEDIDGMTEEGAVEIVNMFYESGPRLKFKKSYPFMAEGIIQKDSELFNLQGQKQLKVYSGRVGMLKIPDTRLPDQLSTDFVWFLVVRPGEYKGFYFGSHSSSIVSTKFPDANKIEVCGFGLLAHATACREDSYKENRWVVWNDSLGLMKVNSASARTQLKKESNWDKQLDTVRFSAFFERGRFVVRTITGQTSTKIRSSQFSTEAFLATDAVYRQHAEDDAVFYSNEFRMTILMKYTFFNDAVLDEPGRIFEIVVVPSFAKPEKLEFRGILLISDSNFWKSRDTKMAAGKTIRDLLIERGCAYAIRNAL